MTDKPECRPPAEFKDLNRHWVVNDKHKTSPTIAKWADECGVWLLPRGDKDLLRFPWELADLGYTYLAPCRPDDAVERVRLQALVDEQAAYIKRLREAIGVFDKGDTPQSLKEKTEDALQRARLVRRLSANRKLREKR